jgi:xanthine dehydrogenase small subunit
MGVELKVNGATVDLPDDGGSLLDALRESLGVRSVKDGCSPQGQCGCCTVLVDGAPRVACVTPLRRVAGRAVTTVEGLEEGRRRELVTSFVATGASQCGFCTPGILCRLAALPSGASPAQVEHALLAHLCRCTGWRTIVDAATRRPESPIPGTRDLAAAARRAQIEGRTPQQVGPDVVCGGGGFADDAAPAGGWAAVPAAGGGWSVAPTLPEARAAAGKVQGRRSGRGITWPLEVPPGAWDLTLQTTWVEPGYLEPDASWCRPGGSPASPLANGGAFGGKADSPAPAAARALADHHGRPIRVVFAREDVVRLGPKRPPIAAGIKSDGTGVVRVVRTPGIAEAIARSAPGLVVEEVDVVGPPTSAGLRAAGWAEAAVLVAAAGRLAAGGASPGAAGRAGGAGAGRARVVSPEGAEAAAGVEVDTAGRPRSVAVTVRCGPPLDAVVVRSYAVGAAHMALGWVCSEGIAVGDDGIPDDLTIRSFGILRARDTPEVEVTIEDDGRPPVNGSDAVFAAVAAATWIAQGLPRRWPTGR